MRVERDLKVGGTGRDLDNEDRDSRVLHIGPSGGCGRVGGVSDRSGGGESNTGSRGDDLGLELLVVEREVSRPVVVGHGDGGVGVDAPFRGAGGVDLVLEEDLLSSVEEPDTSLDGITVVRFVRSAE